jgi:Catalase
MDKQLFTEYPEQDERKYYDLLIQQVKKRMDNLYKDSERALRDTHTKTHTGVKATLEIFDIDEDGIKGELSKKTSLTASQLNAISTKQGLLAKPKQYPVWLRFANGRTKVENDFVSDTRSMAVKVMGVEGERLGQSHESHTQDFIVQNAEIFFIKTIKNYYGFFGAIANWEPSALLWLLAHPKQFSALKTITSRNPKSLLSERYWSGSASALGINPDFDASQPGVVPVTYPAAVKYAFTPVSNQAPHSPLAIESRSESDRKRAQAIAKDSNQPDNYYRNELIAALAKPDACYCWDFGIQFQTNPTMSIDDATIVWQESESPFFTVGRLTVKHQIINFDQQFDFIENLRFSPWNGLAVHRPVGALNRLRSFVYPVVASYRHQKRGFVYQEPTGNETF